MFKTYQWMNTTAVTAAFGIAAAFIGISASRHNTALTKCQSDFFKDPVAGSTSATDSKTLCNIFTWVDIGLMAGLWVVLAVFQVRRSLRRVLQS